MGAQFVKGWTNNHLTFVMVDATDFATPESALSAATKIKIYGKVKGSTGVNFVSSGTGSLTNDIQHVGASATGIYTIALAKADLSDASAAWYDQYIINLSATGAAYQTLIVDGGIWISDLSAIASDIRSDVSDMHSDLIVMSGILSDVYSAVLLTQSLASDTHSRCVVIQSMASDAHSAAAQGNSRCLVIQSLASDIDSALTSQLSDIKSAIANGGGGTITASDISDIASAVWATALATKVVSLSASDLSDLRSAISAGAGATVTASDISDIASAVWAHAIGTRVDSRILVAQSFLSDIRSDVSDMHSDLIVMSGILSDVYSAMLVTQSLVSDTDSALTSRFSNLESLLGTTGVPLNASSLSDIRSAITAITASVSASDISDIASAVWANTIGARVDSRIRLIQSDTSDLSSRVSSSPATKSQVASATFALFASHMSDVTSAFASLSDAVSDLRSLVTTTGVQLNASSLSDLRSAIAAGPAATVTASDISDIASAVWAFALANKTVTLSASDMSDLRSAISAGAGATVTASDISDIASAVWAHVVGARVDSRILVAQSTLSDIRSDVSDMHSDLLVMSGVLSDTYSAVLLTQSLASDAHSAAVVAQSISASDMSDIRSAITAGGAASITASDISDIASAVWANAIGTRVDSRVLATQSLVSDVQSTVAAGVPVGSVGTAAIGAASFSAGGLNAIADAFLDRNMATGTDSGTNTTSVRTPRQALRALRNKVNIAGGTATVTKEDDTTTSWTAAVSTAAGDPISGVDPS